MILPTWLLVFPLEFLFIRISSQSSAQKRTCAFQVSGKNKIYSTFGNVSGSTQLCENTLCCVGYYIITDGQPEIDVLACDFAERSCPHVTCKAQTRFKGHAIKCVCNTDLCNSNITLPPGSEVSQLNYSSSGDDTRISTMTVAGALLVLVLCFVIVFAKRQNRFNGKEESQLNYYVAAQLCSFQTAQPSKIDVSSIELQQLVANGNFATVWKGRYQETVVAVKVFPASKKHIFTAEKEVYELPLMKHTGVVHFLGSGRKPNGGSWLIVLQFAEYGSLRSFLSKNPSNWKSSLKLCQSLSQGLSYLHSDLRRHDAHKPPVAHRDLSSSNVLVKADGTCTLCDFGYSTILHSLSRHHGKNGTNMLGPTQRGTLRYMSPEILEGSVNLTNSSYLMQGDIYALALLLWEIWMRCIDLFEGGIVPRHLLPYESELGSTVTKESLTLHVCHKDCRPSIPPHWGLSPQGSVLREVLTECWDCDPDARLTAQCVADRLLSLQAGCHKHVNHLHASLSVTSV
ncbi:LOW QUALITY PROTEIN: anti-Muellerian hormone type-2 receptor-like [Brachionichthys hirsutus]|uniref:LOW QUALITY PROTEIN: anti-Muellerian hormone type-2 receptor-like n=1 Tax=Brachionichthys hirsutus TaxID=412623 RepID=UPI003604720E